MTQANDTSSETAVTDVVAYDLASSGVSLGDKLRLAREQRSLSLEQVSEALHLDEEIIVSLEQGRFETLGAPVYVRGHLKTYARLLGLSSSEIVSEFQGDESELITAPKLQQQTVVTSVTVNPVLLAGGGLAVLLGLSLGIYVLFGGNELDNPVVAEDPGVTPTTDAPALIASGAGADISAVRSPPATPDMRRTVAAPQSEATPAQITVAAEVDEVAIVEVDETVVVMPPPIPVARPAATMRLGLQFSQESWVEISDANRRLLFGLQREGDHREISGEPPFSLLIGNARAVELTINNEPFAVPAAHVRGKVARFEITGEETD